MSADTLKLLGSEVCNKYLGFLPTSNSTKPPHIANGLFRSCCGEVCDVNDVHKWIISERRKGSLSSEQIVEEYQDILTYGNQEKATGIKEFRSLLEELFNQDRTAYPSYKDSVYNISSHWFIKRNVPAEAKIGDFIFEILAKKIDGKRSPAIELIQNTLKVDNDDFTKIVKPIITFPSEQEKRTICDVDYPSEEDILWNVCKETIRNGFDNLANNIKFLKEDKNSLLVLERMVNYAGFAAFFYLIGVNAAIYNGENVPIVLDSGKDLESIKKSSEHSYTAAKKAVEDYFINSIFSILTHEVRSGSKNACLNWINEMSFADEKRENLVKPAILSYFNSFCEDGVSPLLSLAHALQIAIYTFEYKNTSPSDFCRVLGVRCGLIGPKGNRAKVKRYLINSFMLETITLSILSTDDLRDGLEIKKLGEKAANFYNILFGVNAENEYKILEDFNIAQNTPGDLRGDLSINAASIADTYISLGLARRYADGVTLVGWGL